MAKRSSNKKYVMIILILAVPVLLFLGARSYWSMAGSAELQQVQADLAVNDPGWRLEEIEAARARGATIYAEVLAYGTSNDAHHMAQPEPEAIGVGEMMRAAIERADLEPEDVDYINAHGTSTPLGDAAETKAIKDVFGDHAYELAVSSTKSMMGHCFGAAGAIEAMMCVLALHEGKLPPTINYEHPDPVCDLDYVPNEAREADVRVALSNAIGLGGHNACVLLGRVD